jgi:APA family basic amino acid/polyamine antiporter
MLPSALTQVAEGGTPRVALTVSVLIAAAFAATGTYMTIIATNTALSVFVVLIANAAAIGLRRREPGLQRPFRMPFYPLPALIALAINGALLGAFIFEDPVNSLAGLAVLVVVGLTYLGIDRARSGSIGLSSTG